ncbi:MAG: universal stress protein [Anaerolineae bacterium]
MGENHEGSKMNTDAPKRLFCAVRGGPESRDTATHAIDLALQLGARLTFFRVMDAEFLNHATIGPLRVVYAELREVAKFAMLILCDRAQRRGVAEVDYVIQEGNVREKLRSQAVGAEGEILVMGRPIRSPGSNIFKAGEIDDFIAELEQKGNIQVISVSPSKADQEPLMP